MKKFYKEKNIEKVMRICPNSGTFGLFYNNCILGYTKDKSIVYSGTQMECELFRKTPMDTGFSSQEDFYYGLQNHFDFCNYYVQDEIDYHLRNMINQVRPTVIWGKTKPKNPKDKKITK